MERECCNSNRRSGGGCSRRRPAATKCLYDFRLCSAAGGTWPEDLDALGGCCGWRFAMRCSALGVRSNPLSPSSCSFPGSAASCARWSAGSPVLFGSARLTIRRLGPTIGARCEPLRRERTACCEINGNLFSRVQKDPLHLEASDCSTPEHGEKRGTEAVSVNPLREKRFQSTQSRVHIFSGSILQIRPVRRDDRRGDQLSEV